jgi:hypothetical protein
MRRLARTRLSLFMLGVLTGLLLLSPASAHVTDSSQHLWTDHIRPRLASPGSLNASGNPVDWTKLKNVPHGLADGDDAVGPRGPEGPEGPQGPRGPEGPAGALGSFNEVEGMSCTRGGREGRMHITYASDGDVTLSCLYPAAIVTLNAPSWNVGVHVGEPRTMIFTLTNKGGESLRVTDAYITGDNSVFTVTGDTCTGVDVPVRNGTCDITVRFLPVRSVTYVATLVIESNAERGAINIPLSGYGV